jgi:hypothetical protein
LARLALVLFIIYSQLLCGNNTNRYTNHWSLLFVPQQEQPRARGDEATRTSKPQASSDIVEEAADYQGTLQAAAAVESRLLLDESL